VQGTLLLLLGHTAISGIWGSCGGSCNCIVSSLRSGSLLMFSWDHSKCSLLAVSAPQASIFIIMCGCTNRSNPQVSDTSLRWLFPNFTWTQLLGYWTPPTSASLSPVMKFLFKGFRVMSFYYNRIFTAFFHPTNFHFAMLGNAGNPEMLIDVLAFTIMLKMSRCVGGILTTQVRFERSAKGKVLNISTSFVQDLLYRAIGLIFC